jgi:hypothetical protein
MGNPLHYSLELPQRCLQLIEELWPFAEKTRQPGHSHLGPLTTTFLISMSMPILNLPVERIERYKDETGQGYADDRHLNRALAEAVITVLGGRPLRRSPFFIPDAWSFAFRDAKSHFNVADEFPEDLAEELATKKAPLKAAQMETSQGCSILRNALAHGGIAYLDECGRSGCDRAVKMFAFISRKYDGSGDQKKLIGANILRMSEVNYRDFLRKWVAWLERLGIARDVAA